MLSLTLSKWTSWEGGANRPCCPPGSTLQDDERYEVVPNSSFVISRTAHRSNKSDYYINDRKSNFTEVTELLKGKGIDLDNNRFLILQVGRERAGAKSGALPVSVANQ